MRAFVITGPRQGAVQEVAPPSAAPGEAVVAVERVGLCGTDVELFTGEMAYLHQGLTSYPIRLGHEWSGTVIAVGAEADERWLGTRVAGDTMLGCGCCPRCTSGYQHVCPRRVELGIRDGRPGALAEQVAVPVSSLHALPDSVDATLGALVEPAGNAVRAVDGAGLAEGERVLVMGPGTIGLLCALIARARGADVHLMGREGLALQLARDLGFASSWTREQLPHVPFQAVIDASNSPELPALAVDLVEPGRRVVWIGLAGAPSLLDTRAVALKDVTAVGILGGSQGLAGAIELFASGVVNPRPLVDATVGALDDVAAVLSGKWTTRSSAPKLHIDPGI